MSAFIIRGRTKDRASHTDVAGICEEYESVVLDVGAGDGKGSLRYARTHPNSLVIALDSSYEALEKTSRVAAKKPARGGVSNLVCLYGNIKEAHDVLSHCANHIRVILPWGDLLEGIAQADPSILSALSSCGAQGSHITLVINAEIWKNNLPHHLAHLGEITPDFFTDLRETYAKYGISLSHSGLMTDDEIRALDTTWTAKLMSSRAHADFVIATGIVSEQK